MKIRDAESTGSKPSKTTNEKPVPHIPLRFEDAIAAALDTPPERKPKKKPIHKAEGKRG